MSTRSNIVFKRIYSAKSLKANEVVYVYHHHDGYPTGVGRMMTEYMNSRWSSFEGQAWQNFGRLITEVIKGVPYESEDGTIGIDETFEYTCGLHGDIDYLYTVVTEESGVHIRCEKLVYYGEGRGSGLEEVFYDTPANLMEIDFKEFDEF